MSSLAHAAILDCQTQLPPDPGGRRVPLAKVGTCQLHQEGRGGRRGDLEFLTLCRKVTLVMYGTNMIDQPDIFK